MKERGIIFSAPMVLALLAGRKTVTRRMSKQWLKLQVGQRLWVRETFALEWSSPHLRGWVHYVADKARLTAVDAPLPFPALKSPTAGPVGNEDGVHRPAIHMPRWASRILLEVTEPVRVELAQHITDADAKLEGFPLPPGEVNGEPVPNAVTQARDGFRLLWSQLNKKPGQRWEDNPAVRRIAFRRITETT